MAPAAKRILVVDDEPSICEGVEMLLSREGYEVRTAFSGEQAVEMAGKERFDLILMDLIMPGIDGVEACTRIRSQTPDARLMAISGSPGGQRVENFIRAGGSKVFLYKPFGRAELMSSVQKVLGA
jgi:CheY-like chemotaxis protein